MQVLITGASGGIGYAVTEFLAEKGVFVYACDLHPRNFPQKNVRFLPLDVCDSASIGQAYAQLHGEGVTLDAIVHIAGVFEIDSFIEIEESRLKRLFDVNLMGVINVNRVLYPLLGKTGRIVITTSDVAPLDPMPFNGIYNVSKTALDAYAQALRQELNLLGQRVITVRPGAFDTALSKGSLTKTQELQQKTELYRKQSAKFYRLVKGFMGKPASPTRLAHTYYRAITAKNPRLIYKKHPNLYLRLLNALPKRWQCAIIKAILH